MVNRLPVRNLTNEFLCLVVEPLGEDFWLKPQETLVVTYTADDGHDSELSMVVATDHVQAWINEGDPCNFKVTDGSGAEVTCGHQRPPGGFAHSPED
ncbi:hypothetical protein [Actinomadura violacea]|uniref:Uncharacterized protein n=1 Tax=Actinomadura violacea TaxID=2819934 RepID=A0ABS3RHL7_9ACTN|nr:hypothetical protein [Actinomadura violacea]MBO2456111.1 hypothetical protein [Actinomadura violacea]